MSERARRLEEAWVAAQLVRLAAHAGRRRAASPFHTDARFLAWLDADLQGRAHAGEGWPAERVEGVAEALRARVAAVRLRVRSGEEAMREQAPPVRGTVAQTLDDADAARCAPRLRQAIAAGAGRELWDDDCESWVKLPPGLPTGRFVALTVAGESMQPLFHPGDVVLVKLGEAVTRDTVVVARVPDGGYVVKRVGQVTRGRLELHSLNAAFPPVTVMREPGVVVGTVVMRWCEHAPAVCGRSGVS